LQLCDPVENVQHKPLPQSGQESLDILFCGTHTRYFTKTRSHVVEAKNQNISILIRSGRLSPADQGVAILLDLFKELISPVDIAISRSAGERNRHLIHRQIAQ
jgi:hypothetical protein